MSRSINDILNAWYGSTDEVNRMARDMLHAGEFNRVRGTEFEANNLLDFIEKPHHWNAEHAWWIANEWPDDEASWERGREREWEIDYCIECGLSVPDDRLSGIETCPPCSAVWVKERSGR